MHSGKGRHEVESAHKGKIVEDVVPELAPVPRRTIKPLWVCVGDWENVLLYSKLYHFEYSRRTTSPVDEHLMTPYMQANSTYKEERQKILQSREKKKERKITDVVSLTSISQLRQAIATRERGTGLSSGLPSKSSREKWVFSHLKRLYGLVWHSSQRGRQEQM